MLSVGVKPVRHGCPLCFVDEFGAGAVALLLVGDNPIVDIHVIEPEGALLGQ